MNSTYLYCGLGTVASLYLLRRLLRKSPPKTVIPNSVIHLVDQNLDQIFSITSLLCPSPGAFDKPFEMCKRIDSIPQTEHIKLIICTSGGSLTNCEKILRKLLSHPAGYTAYIRNECFSAGAIIALGAKEIVMKKDSYLGKIDPQIASQFSSYPAIVYHDVPEHCITDQTIANIRISGQVLNHMEQLLDMIFGDNEAVKLKVKENMVYSNLPHSKTFDKDACISFGLNIREPRDDEQSLF